MAESTDSATTSQTIVEYNEIPITPQKQPKDNKNFADLLKCGCEAFQAEAHDKAAQYFKLALNSKNKNVTDERTIILTRYMLCMCWLESTDAKNLLDTLKVLKELVQRCGTSYPMLYYAVAKAYFKLYRFTKAYEMLKEGFALSSEEDVDFEELLIPGSNNVIPESTRKGFQFALRSLSEQCFAWCCPNAVCCWAECSSTVHSEGADKNIFFRSPTFSGMIKVTCSHPSNPCVMSFHIACWKAKKDSLGMPKKISSKEVGHLNCFTPNCVDDKGELSTLKKIEILNDKACVKATIEARVDNALKHTKTIQSSKGAAKKQQQPKLKIPSENRPPFKRNPRPATAPKDSKPDAIEEEDDINDEQALSAAVDKLAKLRARRFGLDDCNIWQPNLPMYGNKYMLATADLEDLDFPNGRSVDTDESFILSYMFALISHNGPMSLAHLEEEWIKVQMLAIGQNFESVLNRHADIAEFLTQSLKFSIVDNYICTPDKLPEAYELAKNDATAMLRCFIDNDVDQYSIASSLDEEATLSDITTNEKINSASPCPTLLDNAETKETHGVSNVTVVPMDKEKYNLTTGLNEMENIPGVENGLAAAEFTASKPATNTQALEISEIASVTKNSNVIGGSESPAKKKQLDHSRTLEISADGTSDDTSTEDTRVVIREDSPEENTWKTMNRLDDDKTLKHALNKISSVDKVENQLTEMTRKLEKLMSGTKSTNKLKNYGASVGETREQEMNDGDNLNVCCETREPRSPALFAKSTEIVESKADAGDAKIRPECPNTFLLLDRVEKFERDLRESRKETETLRSEIKQLKKDRTTSTRQLKEIFLEQHESNKNLINAFIAYIPQMIGLHGSPIAESERLRFVGIIGEMIVTYQNQLTALLEQLCPSLETKNPQEVHFPREKVTKPPKTVVTETPEFLLNVYKEHRSNESPMLLVPQGQHPLMFPQYGPVSYYYPNVPENNPDMYGKSPPNQMYPVDIPRPDLLQHPAGGAPMAPVLMMPQNFYQLPPQLPNSIQPHTTYAVPSVAQNNPATYPQNWKHVYSYGKSDPPLVQNTAPNRGIFEQEMIVPSQQTCLKPDTKEQVKGMSQQPEQLLDRPQSTNTATPKIPSERKIVCDKGVAGNASQTSNSNSQSNVSTPRMEQAAHDTVASPQNRITIDNTCTANFPVKKTSHATPGRSLDRLMQRLRSCYVGVLELDLLKSIECVRAQRKSLSNVPMHHIIRDVHKYIDIFQKRQLCGYSKPQVSPTITTYNSTPVRERARQNSTSSAVPSTRQDQPVVTRSKRQWEPVSLPNDSWTNIEDTECIICFETIENTESYTLQCKHSFHKKCIQDWYKHQTGSEWIMGSCPLCRLPSTIDNEYPPLPLG